MKNTAIPSSLNGPGVLGKLLVPQKLSIQFVQSKQELRSQGGMKLVSALKIANERRDTGKTITENIMAAWLKANILWHM